MNSSLKTQPTGVTLAVGRMTCAGCARTIERALLRLPGVQRATVDFDRGVATITGSAGPTELVAAIEAAGYAASPSGEDKNGIKQ
jgi:copper chaperone CopZ